MKKKFIFILALLPLVSCGRNAPASSSASSGPAISSSEGITSAASSSIAPFSPEFYQQALMRKTDCFKITRNGTVKKGSEVYRSSAESQTLDLTHQIEHTYSRVSTLAGYEDNTDTTTVETDVYSTADAVYRKGYDNKYHVEAGVTMPTTAYHLSYDFAKLSAMAVVFESYEAHFSAKVAQSDLAAFGLSKLNDVTDFAFSAVLSKAEGYLDRFDFDYTQKGYTVHWAFAVSSLEETLALPTV